MSCRSGVVSRQPSGIAGAIWIGLVGWLRHYRGVNETISSLLLSYIAIATPLGQVDPLVIDTALAALEQLAALPSNYAEARDIVAIALGKAIQKKLAA